MACLDPDGALGLATLVLDLDYILAANAKLLRRRNAQKNGISPSDLNHRLGQFLQPAVVGETPVVNGWVLAEQNFYAAAGWLWRRKSASAGCDRFRRRRAIGDKTVMQHATPPRLVIGAGVLRFPVIANDVVANSLGIAQKESEEFVIALSVIER